MEVIQIINDGSGTSNPWGGFLSFDGGINQGQIFQDIVLAPFEPQPIAPQYYIVDADGSFLPIVDGNNFTFIAPEADDEIPSHKLDHMYAKKPREPGTELVKPTRRRSKKKELMTSHYYVHEMIDESPPKINIIRSRHAMTPPGHSRPKILTSPPKMLSTFPSTNMFSNSSYCGYNNSTVVSKSNLKTKVEEIPAEAVVLDDYDEFNAPSPGAVVTVCDGVEMDPIIVSARSLKSSKKVTYHISSGLSPSYIENRSSSLDSIGEPDDDSELFLDFPIEESEEVDTTIDVDFNEIHMNSNNGIDLLRSTPITYFHHNNETDDVEFVVAEHELTDHEAKYELPIHKSESEEEIADSPQSPNCTRKRGRPVKVQSNVFVGDDELTASTSYIEIARPKPRGKDDANQNFQVLAPTRRSTRPVKAPSRLDDIEDVSSAKRKRR